MQAYPLLRVKWSNEHIMAALFGVLILYLLPGWLDNRYEIINFLVLLAAALLIDTTANFIAKKQLVCAVSSAVTAAILQVITPGIPLYGRLLGIIAALALGKHLWGGTGKNPLNPALTGFLLICLFFPMKDHIFTASALFLPAILLSLPFIIFRPYASVGFMSGMIISILITGNFSFSEILSTGVLFWGCIVLTDPVTITPNPVIGGIAGVIGGLFSLSFSGIFLIILIILVINTISTFTEKYENSVQFKRLFFFIPKKIKFHLDPNPKFYDLTGESADKSKEEIILNSKYILDKIEENEVFGHGGASFPTVSKIKTAIASGSPKHFIINAVECDPGLLHDKWLLKNKPAEIKLGIDAVSRCADFDSVTLAVKDNSLSNDFEHNSFIIKTVPDYFPVGAERFLIKEVLGKSLDESEIPSEKGILVLNLQTIYAVYEAVYNNKKADSRFITVVDLVHKSGNVVKVKLGTKVGTVLDSISLQGFACYFGGGAMQCISVSEEEAIDKNTNFIAAGEGPIYKESPVCSRCGFCKLVCPSGLAVNKVADLIDSNLTEQTLKYSPKSCLQCGRCSSVCLAGRNLSNRMKAARDYSKGLA